MQKFKNSTTSIALLISAINANAQVDPQVDIFSKLSDQNPLFANVWLPLHPQESIHHLFATVDGALSPNKHNGNFEGGAVYRQRLNNHWGFGAYTYTTFNRALTGKNFFTLNPGIEMLSEQWHVSGNTYLPVSSTHQAYGDWVWAQDVGINQYIQFANHREYDQQVQLTSSTGTGFDVMASYRIAALANTEVGGGIYYFNMPTHPVGYGVQLNTPNYKRVSFNLGFLHDPLLGNQFSIGLKIGLSPEKTTTNDWINTPVQHNLPLITEANTIPIYSGYRNQGAWQLQRDNIWFFDPNGESYDASKGVLNCTYEHPCSTLNNESTIDIGALVSSHHFNDQPAFYLRPGDYSPSTSLILINNESLFGRTYDYKQPAKDASAHLYTGVIIIDHVNGNTVNTLADLSLFNVGEFENAIGLLNVDEATIDNVQMGGFNLPDVRNNYSRGVLIVNSRNVTISNSHIMLNNYFSGDTVDLYGIAVLGNVDHLTINNSDISSKVVGSEHKSIGLQVQGTGSITLNNNRFDQYTSGLNSTVTNIQIMPGISANLTIDKGQFLATSLSDNTSAQHLLMGGNSQVNIRNASFFGSTTSTGSNLGVNGFVIYDTSHLTLENSTVSNEGSSIIGSSYATNLGLHDQSQAAVTNTTLYAAGQSALVSGSTNITTGDNSIATIHSSFLETTMAGGPSGGEPSGAVALWSINNSQINLLHSQVIAKSLNHLTGALTLQSQDQANIRVSDSTLSSYYLQGNTTNAGPVSIVAGSDSQIAITSSQIYSILTGETNHDMILLATINNSSIQVTNSTLTMQNDATPIGPITLKTIAAKAFENSLIYLNSAITSLTGPNPTVSETQGNGQVIITG